MGGANETLTDSERWDEQKCQKLIDGWYEVYGGIRHYQDDIKTTARRWAKVEDMFGRVRLIPEVVSAHSQIREAGIRQACNAPIQMAEVGMIKRAMKVIWGMIDNELGRDKVKPLLQIYDSLLFEVEEGMGEWVGSLFKSVMEDTTQLIVPVIANVAVGKNWGQMKGVEY